MRDHPTLARRSVCAVAIGLVLSAVIGWQPLSAQTAAPSNELAGLWSAKKRFGPDTRGTLVVLRDGDTYVADLAGRVAPVQAAGNELTFSLPEREGFFRGKVDGRGAITGHWLRYGTRVSGSDARRSTTPGRLPRA